MKIHAIQTGSVKITQNWVVGRGPDKLRLAYTLFDKNFTPWLPIYVWVIEHPEGLLVVDTGIPANANDPIYFPPFMRLVQRAAPFDIVSAEAEVGPQMRKLGLLPEEVRWVVLTHLHQDHEGGLHHFPKAEFMVSQTEWTAAQGIKGRLNGYLNHRWPDWFRPTLIDFESTKVEPFLGSFTLTRAKDVHLVSTPGHSAGHLSVIMEEDDHALFFAGDASYTEELLLNDIVDGIGPSPAQQHDTHQRILKFATQIPTVYLPSHEIGADKRLLSRKVISPNNA